VQRQPNHCDCGVFVLYYLAFMLRSPTRLAQAVLDRTPLDRDDDDDPDGGRDSRPGGAGTFGGGAHQFGSVDEIVAFRAVLQTMLRREKEAAMAAAPAARARAGAL
ncbi:hypothetical protein HK405_002018, partial [Cladochytrium tenue]